MSGDRRELTQVARWITERLGAGRTPEEVTAELGARGIPEEQARVWVERMASALAQGRVAVPAEAGGSARERLVRVMGAGGGVVGLVVVFGLLNGALYLGQEVLARDDVARAETLEATLFGLDPVIDSLEAWLDEREAENKELDARGRQVDALATRPTYAYRGSLAATTYQREVDQFISLADQWNHVTLPAFRRGIAQYDSLISHYNTLVDEYNTVAEAAYSRWWIIPVPAPGRRSASLGPRARSTPDVGGS